MLQALTTLNIAKLGDLFSEGNARGWAEDEGHDFTPLTQFHFHRVRCTLRALLGDDMQEPPELMSPCFLLRSASLNKMICTIYDLSQEFRRTQSTKARLEWQSDLGVVLDDSTWWYCCEVTQHFSLNGRHRLIHFKFLNRVYYTPERLFQYRLRDTADCERCRAGMTGFMHVAWFCPKIAEFWEKIIHTLNKITGLSLTPDPMLALLGYTRELRKGVRRLIAMGLLLAKRRIVMRWARWPVTSVADWSKDMLYCNMQSELYSELLPPQNHPKCFWGLYEQYFVWKETGEPEGNDIV